MAYCVSTAQAVRDQVRERMPESTFPRVFGRMSFFVNAGIRFVEGPPSCAAMGQLWEEIEPLPLRRRRRSGSCASAMASR